MVAMGAKGWWGGGRGLGVWQAAAAGSKKEPMGDAWHKGYPDTIQGCTLAPRSKSGHVHICTRAKVDMSTFWKTERLQKVDMSRFWKTERFGKQSVCRKCILENRALCTRAKVDMSTFCLKIKERIRKWTCPDLKTANVDMSAFRHQNLDMSVFRSQNKNMSMFRK